eukprot:1024288-Ditylum_brightwellii.AAC.1
MGESAKVQFLDFAHCGQIKSSKTNEKGKNGGILWGKDVDIPEPSDKCSFTNSTIQPKYKGIFDTK